MSGAVRIHPTALIEDGVVIGPGTSIWDNVHVRGPSTIGRDCIIGEKTYVAYGVRIGDYVKVNAQVYVCTGVTLEDRVFVAAGVVFTNDRFPRAFVDGTRASRPRIPTRTRSRRSSTPAPRSAPARSSAPGSRSAPSR
jgi:UDP-3-O-[3-hydroxymyristoyl] glucosamine N-acyltransferase